MIGRAKPAEIRVEIQADVSQGMIDKLIRLAEQSSFILLLLFDVKASCFQLKTRQGVARDSFYSWSQP
jgi:hypothetical protein